MDIVYDEFRGEVIDSETGVIIEDHVPNPMNDINVLTNTRPNLLTSINDGLGSVVRGRGKIPQLHSQVVYWRNGTHVFVLDFMHRALSYLGLYDEPKDVLVERAMHIFRTLSPVLRKVLNASPRALAVVSLLITLSEFRFPITSVEKVDIIELSGVKPKVVKQVARHVFRLTGSAFRTPPPQAYLRRFCSEFGVPEDVCGEAREFLRGARGGRIPECVAVEAILKASPPNSPWLRGLREVCRSPTRSHGRGGRTPRASTSSRRRS